MGSKNPTFACLAKAPLYQTPYSNFTIPFFNIFYYFIYIYIYIFFTTPKIPTFLIFFLPSLSLPLFPLFSPHFFSSVSLSSVLAWCILPPPSFFLYPFSSVFRSARTHYRRLASSENPHPSVQGGSLESENCKNKNKISIKISFSFSSFCFFFYLT
jgi:hypothetical protein